jgi:apolipoprotein N-acyltransferase
LFVINDRGDILDYYDKSHLVPFGEYLPLREYLPDFMRPITNIVGTLGKGEKYKNIKVNGLPTMGGAICYESIFPSEVVNKKDKPELLLVLVNDGWYGISSGPFQHLVAAQMRAVEEGVTVIRSANTGISAVIADKIMIIDGDIGKNINAANIAKNIKYVNFELTLFFHISFIVTKIRIITEILIPQNASCMYLFSIAVVNKFDNVKMQMKQGVTTPSIAIIEPKVFLAL